MVGSRVYVGRLPYGVRERDLEKFFKKFGKTRDILLKNGYGFVEFEDFRDADDAVYELNGKELLGERVIVEPARGIDRSSRRDRYGGGGGGGGGGGRGRDRYGGGGGGGRGSRYEYAPPTRTDHRLIVENLSSKVNWQATNSRTAEIAVGILRNGVGCQTSRRTHTIGVTAIRSFDSWSPFFDS